MAETSAIGKLPHKDPAKYSAGATMREAWRENINVHNIEGTFRALLPGPEQAETRGLLMEGLHLVYNQGFLDGTVSVLNRLEVVARSPEGSA